MIKSYNLQKKNIEKEIYRREVYKKIRQICSLPSSNDDKARKDSQKNLLSIFLSFNKLL